MKLKRKSETMLKEDGEKMVLFKDSLQGLNRKNLLSNKQTKEKRKKEKINFKKTTPILTDWEKKPQKYSQNIKFNETAKNVEC